MKLIDQINIEHPCYGSRRITEEIRQKGIRINRKRTERLMKKMGIIVEYPKKQWKTNGGPQAVYPYLLGKLCPIKPNIVWCTDITYIPTSKGYFYLIAVMDWHSRYVLSWRLTNTLEAATCVEALEEAFEYGKPIIFNTDQGSQFTSNEFTGFLKAKDVAISMAHRGRCFDNIFIERLWRTVKYEEVYIKNYYDGHEAYRGIKEYMNYYNNRRIHSSLNYLTPKRYHFENLNEMS